MKIRTKLYLNLVILAAFFLMLTAIILWGSRQIDEGLRQGEIGDTIVRGIFELSTLTSEMMIYHDDIRPRKQWLKKHGYLTEYMSEIEFAGPEIKDVLDRINIDLKKVKADYMEFYILHDAQAYGEEAHYIIDSEIEVRLIGQLLLHSQEIVNDAFRLIVLSHREQVSIKQRTNILIMVSIIMLMISISMVTYLVNRSILRPLGRLNKGTEIVGHGDLDYRVEVNSSHDEIGELGNSFNQMIESLKEQISERELAMEALEISERKHRLLLENLPQKIFYKDRDSVYVSCNDNYADDLNIKSEEINGKTDYDFYPGELADKYREDDKKVMAAGEITEVEEGYVVEGERSFVHTVKSPIRDERGIVIGILGIFWDVTERRKLEEQLRHFQRMQTVGQLAGGVAHDFNNILSVIISYAHLMLMKAPNDEQRENLQHILGSADRAATLTKNLLAFSRKQIMNPKAVKLNDVIKNVENLILRVIGENVEIRTLITDEDLTVMADSGQLDQVLLNFATNSRDAMPHGGEFTIETKGEDLDSDFVRMHGYGEPGRYALLSVSDTGKGMDRATVERIFEPFFTTKEVGSGTGLGLAMVYGIIKQHNGYINVYSEPGKGTTFKVYLPLVMEEVEETMQEKPDALTGGTETILLAEDDDSVRKVTKYVLKEFGYTVIEAIDGEEAVEKFERYKDKIQLVILDMIMPKKTGKEAYDLIVKERPGVKVLFQSGYTADTIREKEIFGEDVDFISKPVSPRKLIEKVKEILS